MGGAGRAGALAGALVLAGCATPSTVGPTIAASDVAREAEDQATYVVRARAEEKLRVARVAERLAVANADVCPAKRWGAGFQAAATSDYPSQFRGAAGSALGLASQPTVIYVAPGGPAEAAGVAVGDRITAAGGQALEGQGAGKAFRAYLTRSARSEAPLTMMVAHAGAAREVTLRPRPACGYPARVTEDADPNAYADGEGVFVTRGMLRLASTDDELAVVIGHEMAHDAERHIAAKQRNAVAGAVGGALLDGLALAAGVNTGGAFARAGQQAGMGYASADFEREADYVGLYLAARAGYDIGHAEEFWRKMSVEFPKAVFVTTDHPANAQRYVAIASTRREIEGKRAQSLALLPQRRGAAPAGGAVLEKASTAAALTAAAK